MYIVSLLSIYIYYLIYQIFIRRSPYKPSPSGPRFPLRKIPAAAYSFNLKMKNQITKKEFFVKNEDTRKPPYLAQVAHSTNYY